MSLVQTPAALPDDRIVVLDGAPRGCHDFETLVSASPDTSIPDRGVMPDDLMNIQYTSGTTGFPKGCMLSHDYWMLTGQTAFHWDAVPAERLLTAQPFFYMDPQWQTLKTMVAGGPLFIAPPTVRNALHRLAQVDPRRLVPVSHPDDATAGSAG